MSPDYMPVNSTRDAEIQETADEALIKYLQEELAKKDKLLADKDAEIDELKKEIRCFMNLLQRYLNKGE